MRDSGYPGFVSGQNDWKFLKNKKSALRHLDFLFHVTPVDHTISPDRPFNRPIMCCVTWRIEIVWFSWFSCSPRLIALRLEKLRDYEILKHFLRCTLLFQVQFCDLQSVECLAWACTPYDNQRSWTGCNWICGARRMATLIWSSPTIPTQSVRNNQEDSGRKVRNLTVWLVKGDLVQPETINSILNSSIVCR